MRVLYLSPSGQIGGAEWSLLNLFTGFRATHRDFNPFLVVTEDGPFRQKAEELGVKTEVLRFPKSVERVGDAAGVPVASIFQSAPEFFHYCSCLRCIVRKLRPSVIQTNGFKMHLAGSFIHSRMAEGGRIPIVGHIHDYLSSRPLAGRLLRARRKQFSYFVANSESVNADLRTHLRTERSQTILNAIDPERFSPAGLRADLAGLSGLPPARDGEICIGLIATFAPWKGHTTFLQALAQLPRTLRWRGYIVGGPIYRTSTPQWTREQLQSEVNRLGLKGRVGLPGYVSNPAEAMRALDIVVHASTKPEPFGMVIAEAMACSRAVIATNSGGAREVFEDRVTGLAYQSGDVGELARLIGDLSRNGELRHRLGAAAREQAIVRYSPARIAGSFETLYRTLATSEEGVGSKGPDVSR